MYLASTVFNTLGNIDLVNDRQHIPLELAEFGDVELQVAGVVQSAAAAVGAADLSCDLGQCTN